MKSGQCKMSGVLKRTQNFFVCLFAYVGNIKSQLNLKRSRSVLTEKI